MHSMTGPAPRVNVSVVIKALNEERRIESAIRTALEAVAIVGGEVVLADSCSTDATIQRASAYPIRIVQLLHATERCCGIGPQLGYQHCDGDFVYILDGDMEMLPGFLPMALAFMQRNPQVAGVGGQVMEMNVTGLEYVARIERGAAQLGHGEVDRLDMGGLYRRSAIAQAGYFSDRNLHSYEELDLAVRLRDAGWKLWRLEAASVKHYGHDIGPYTLLVKRWRTLYICGLGELVRAAWSAGNIRILLACTQEIKLYIAILLTWAGLLALLVSPLAAEWKMLVMAAAVIVPLAGMAWRKKSVAKGVYALAGWAFNAAGMARGFLRLRRPPGVSIDSVVIQNIFLSERGPLKV